jgi:uncharacterized protein (TIGR03435 family)
MRTQLLVTALLSLGMLSIPRAVHAQGPAAPPQNKAFELASVKPNKSGDRSSAIGTKPGGRFEAVNASLRSLVLSAYHLQGVQLVNAPDWIAPDRFDVMAKAVKEITYDEAMPMLQALLVERFGLVVHKETRDLPIFALVVARADGKLGPQLSKAEVDCTKPENQSSVPLPIPCGIGINMPSTGATMHIGSSPISHLVPALSMVVERTVVDRTALSGPYNGTLTWSENQAPDATGASIFTALQEQLGLKLESTRGPVEVLVIDHVEPPTPD